MDPVDAARDLVAARFPAARAAFLGGGVLSDHRTATSDLDIVVLLDGPPAPYRESVRWRGWPAELFVHDRASIEHYFGRDRARRKPSLARMVAGGVTLADRDGAASQLAERARSVLAAGPPPLTEPELQLRRYGLTDLLDDLAGCTDAGEAAVISWWIVMETAELALLLAGSWLGGGKWLLRELRGTSPELAAGLLAALDDPGQLTSVADTVLARAGGRLWEGYRVSGHVPEAGSGGAAAT
jgi:hypothetical protein